MRKLLLLVIILMVFPAMAMAQGDELVEASLMAEFVTFLFGGGLTAAIVQLLRRIGILNYIPALVRPMLAGFIGIGAMTASEYLASTFGILIDFSPIVELFGGGGGAMALFSMGKEAGVLTSKG